MSQTQLPRELISLVHHIELNKSGWWDQATQRFILTIVWLSDSPLNLNEISDSLKASFSAHIDRERLLRQVETLQRVGQLVATLDGHVQLSEKARLKFERDLKEAEDLENDVKKLFINLITNACTAVAGDQLTPEACWDHFNRNFLQPLIREVGANTYQLISGETRFLDSVRFEQFINAYPKGVRHEFRSATTSFLDPKNSKVRSWILRSLTAHFFVEATSLSEETLTALAKASGSYPTFIVFVDTNFLISVLGLKESIDEAGQLLVELMRLLAGRIKIKLYALPSTLDETKALLLNKKLKLSGLRLTPNLTEAALGADLDVIDLKFIHEYKKRGTLTVENYFEPYINGLITVMRERGVEIFNESVDEYSNRQDVLDDISLQQEYEEKFTQNPKTYAQLRHDMILWHFVEDQRSPQIESPLEAKYWILTFDYRLRAFDAFKRRRPPKPVPVCLHPTTFIQMLQFWIPRTPEFEEAILGSMRIPFLSQNFDHNSERVTLDILRALGRYEDVGDLNTESISEILMSKALRQKIDIKRNDEEGQFKIVRDALIQRQLAAERELEEARNEAERFKNEVAAGKQTNEQLESNLSNQLTELQATRDQLAIEAAKVKTLEGTVRRLEEDSLARNNAQQVAYQRKQFVQRWVVSPIFGMTVLGVVAAVVASQSANLYVALGAAIIWLLALPATMWLIRKAGTANEVIKDWTPFQWFARLATVIFIVLGVLWVLLVNIVSNALWEWLKPYWERLTS